MIFPQPGLCRLPVDASWFPSRAFLRAIWRLRALFCPDCHGRTGSGIL